jgi:restriction system protein
MAKQGLERYQEAHDSWWLKAEQIRSLNRHADDRLREANVAYEEALYAFERRSQETKARVTDLKARYEAKDPAAVTTIADLILAESRYPDWIIRDSSTGYVPETGVLIVEDALPTIDAIPNVSKVTYVASRHEMRTAYLKDTERDRLYDSVLYQIALRSIYELFRADRSGVIKAVVYNGWLTSVNKGTGIEETGCLLSLQASRDELSRLDLSKVDPKACFRQLKGISAAKLSGITPVAPIARMNTADPRFVASHEVTSRLDEGVNLASIDWEDFEHLVREIFEREFSVEGSEVKVTRASADGGVDAVVFDPDPIRGGKIVIQAKRYTATVGVSAVRDLYGTMLNEGAMKGILVTTSDYGPDSYSFAKDKPITLLSGGNLLQIMEKHGHKARIDLAEARRLRIASE